MGVSVCDSALCVCVCVFFASFKSPLGSWSEIFELKSCRESTITSTATGSTGERETESERERGQPGRTRHKRLSNALQNENTVKKTSNCLHSL